MSEQIIVWVANRESPMKNKPGNLKLSEEGNLRLFNVEGTSLWSVNISNKVSRAVPGMRFGGQQKLIDWKNSIDPALMYIHFISNY
ncbi:hypothetical protein SUGI_1340830 [Cryptomeria japonica]|uniref:Bulb-type lectin domain-containing protein n=1 Tax=Cryptomeria japonica TaxID=3369 RepID=A0AAD3NQV1_CRYJA|nr:hypothetical protein SUGI_1340620 [Cryptomeria japonica]GLJ57535.1 hypothetical protein SUGI_1340690 [Cryptomeria japonica]GLJ57538.1 hypothetical protein SUGI_1340760 [Cryptomeria japonica]GLJ57541.1 hypothetical protein SUGI_1340830 [Cryptomeria japonica]